MQMWMNASAVRVHTTVKIQSEISVVDVLMVTGCWMTGGRALQRTVSLINVMNVSEM